MSSIFLSHNFTDKPFVRRLAQDLQAAGLRVWLDEAEMQFGDSLIEKIQQGINEMEYLGVILSKHSVQSEWVRREVNIALQQEIEGKRVKVLPFLIDDCEIPLFLKDKLYADFRNQSRYETVLVQVLCRLGVFPEIVERPLPSQRFPSSLPVTNAFSEKELHSMLTRDAHIFSLLRHMPINIQINTEEAYLDWRQATVQLASNILDGSINFSVRIASPSYFHLEDVWLQEVLRLRTYFLWKRRGEIDLGLDKIDYQQVCDDLHQKLISYDIKADITQFKEAKLYLEDHYLSNNRLDMGKESVRLLVARKATRIYETTGMRNPKENWIKAENYAKMFYESIIPAVLDDDPEKVLTILKCLQYNTKAPETDWGVINCFEAVLAIYFLKPKTIQKSTS